MQMRELALLREIIVFCDYCAEYIYGYELEGFENSTLVQHACLFCLVQIGESVSKLSDEFRLQYREVPWRLIKDARNIYVHDYGNVGVRLLWGALNNDVPALRQQCAEIISSEEYL